MPPGSAPPGGAPPGTAAPAAAGPRTASPPAPPQVVGRDAAGRPVERRDPNVPAARGTRSTTSGDDPGAPPGQRPAVPFDSEAASALPPPTPAKPVPKAPPPAPGARGPGPVAPQVEGKPVRKFVPPPPKPPVPVEFPPDDLRAECDALLSRYPQKAAALIPVLHLAQRKFDGWISPEVEAGVARYLGVSDQHVRGVLTFYTMFNTKPVGRHHVQVCRTLSCWLRGARGLVDHLEKRTGLRPGQTDPQRRFTVSEVECIGLCEVAPALFVNDDEHVSMTPQGLDKILDGLK
jgi:NADH-quinone oxidoreductase subunit E